MQVRFIVTSNVVGPDSRILKRRLSGGIGHARGLEKRSRMLRECLLPAGSILGQATHGRPATVGVEFSHRLGYIGGFIPEIFFKYSAFLIDEE